ncbi:MAG: threonine synthase [Brevefilum sp.]|nr:threonine synthase [Brevefilum sp.]MDT8381496.1 threonine synthase [Brevefilum sp.]
MRVRCNECGTEGEFQLAVWRCSCGGAWEPVGLPEFDPSNIFAQDFSIWRYGRMLGLDIDRPLKRMGVGWTPLVPIEFLGQKIHLKLEYLSPSGSFKDRGVNAMVNQLVHMRANLLVEDSSGNAGASLAAHSARFGIKSIIFVPAYASPSKLAQISIYGVDVVPIEGPRSAAEKAAQAIVGKDSVYASHAHNPAYLAGQMTAAWELWEQLDRHVPDWVISPVAQGGQFLGLWFGFKHLQDAGLVDRIPRMVAVQPARIAPLFNAWHQGLEEVKPIDASGPTVAEGVAISQPVRGKRLLQVIKDTNGMVLAIDEDAILMAQQDIARHGYYIEPTSALVIAAIKNLAEHFKPSDIVVVPLTGNGLKGKPKYDYGSKD